MLQLKKKYDYNKDLIDEALQDMIKAGIAANLNYQNVDELSYEGMFQLLYQSKQNPDLKKDF